MSPEQRRLDPNQPPVSLLFAQSGSSLSLLATQQGDQEKCHGDAEGQRRDLHGHIRAHRGTDTEGRQDRRENAGASEGTRIRRSL